MPRRFTPAKNELPDEAELCLSEVKARLGVLGVRGWWRELIRLRDLSLKLGFDWHKSDPKVPSISVRGRQRTYFTGTRVVQLVVTQEDDITLPRHLTPAIIVCLDATDELILSLFKETLRQARELYPPPFKRPGRVKEDGTLRWHSVFYKWRCHRIVELAELLAWRSKLSDTDRQRYPEHLIGSRLGLNRNQTHYAKQVLRDAIACLPMLLSELRYRKKDPEGVTPDHLEANADMSPEWQDEAAALAALYEAEAAEAAEAPEQGG